MKKRIVLIISVLLIFVFGIFAATFDRTSADTKAAVSCSCCSGDSCPMKNKGERSATGENHECCCKDGSCPMKKGQAAGDGMHHQTGQSADSSCDCSCCKHGESA